MANQVFDISRVGFDRGFKTAGAQIPIFRPLLSTAKLELPLYATPLQQKNDVECHRGSNGGLKFAREKSRCLWVICFGRFVTRMRDAIPLASGGRQHIGWLWKRVGMQRGFFGSQSGQLDDEKTGFLKNWYKKPSTFPEVPGIKLGQAI